MLSHFTPLRAPLAILLLLIVGGCVGETAQPDYYQVVELSGTPYERGFQHGQMLASEIRSIYTKLLTAAIFPYLNREREDVASVLLPYQDDVRYGHGKFAETMMRESAYDLLPYIPEEYVQEMQGVADGARLPFDEILLLNTFFDTLMGFRSITFYIKLYQGPSVLRVDFLGDLDGDGIDNDGDGDVDEYDEGVLYPYEPLWYASMVEVPTDTKIRFILDDDKEGVDPSLIRIQVQDTLYTADSPCIQSEPYAREGKTIAVTFTPPEPLPAGAEISLILQASDLQKVNRIKPYHPRSLRDERITFTTLGYGKQPWEVPNRGRADGRTQPPSVAFAVRGTATPDDNPLLAHHFSLLDSDTSHKHVVLFVHQPDDGDPYAYLSYAGLVWGFSGMNSRGMSYAVNTSDTLNTPFAESFNEALIFARLRPTGVPMGFMGREILRTAGRVNQGLRYLQSYQATFGWNFLLEDATGAMMGVELDSDITHRPEGGCHYYTPDLDDPDNLDAFGQPYATINGDEMFVASHYQKDLNEVYYDIVNFHIRPQRYWSSFYFRSLRAFFNMRDFVEAEYGRVDLKAAKRLLGRPELADQRDSMMAAVYEPAKRKIHVAAGEVPATDADFQPYDLGAFARGEEQP